MLGMLTSLVPIMTLSMYHGRMIKNDLDYAKMVRYIPWIMGFLNMLIFAVWVEPYGIQNFFLVGAVFSVIYSCLSFGAFLFLPPQRCSILGSRVAYRAVYAESIS